jgi:CRISPR/Cas system-associated exonuclease Cas4 (RecB family)
MVRGSNKTYGELMLEAAAKTDFQEIGETSEALMTKFKNIIEEAVQGNYDKHVTGRYYIHIWVVKEPYANNALRIYPQCRRTRPSPYQGNDHYLWSVEDGGKVTFEWCIPKKEVLNYILKNPHEFDVNYVRMLRKYVKDTLEKPEDYLVEKKYALDKPKENIIQFNDQDAKKIQVLNSALGNFKET